MDATASHSHATSRRAFLSGGVKLAAGGLLAGTFPSLLEALGPMARGASAATLTDVVYQLGWITNTEFAGTYLAQKLGYFAKHGIDVSILPGGSNPVEPIVASGKAIVGDSNADTVSAAVAAGADLRIIGARYQKNPFCIISSAKKPIKSPAGLVGKKVGVNAYNLTAWNVFLKLNHITSSQVKTVDEGFTSGPSPLADGQVDAWMGFVTNEPGVLELAGFPNYNFLMAEFGYHVYADVYIATTTSIQTQKAELVAFLKGERQGWQEDLSDPTKGLDVTYSLYGKTAALDKKQQRLENNAQQSLIETSYTRQHGLFAMNPADIAANIATLKFASTSATPYYTNTDLFDTSILEAL